MIDHGATLAGSHVDASTILASINPVATPIAAPTVARALGASVRLINRTLAFLAGNGIVSELEGGRYQIGRSPSRLTAADVVEHIRTAGADFHLRGDEPEGARSAIEELTGRSVETLRVPLKDLLP